MVCRGCCVGDQDGGSHSGRESDSSESGMLLLSGDDFQEVKLRKGKRHSKGSGGRSGRSNSALTDGNVDFDNLSFNGRLSALFSKLSQVDSKVEKKNVPLADRVKKSEAVINSHHIRLKLLEYKSIDIESRHRRGNLIFRCINEAPDETDDLCRLEVRRCLACPSWH